MKNNIFLAIVMTISSSLFGQSTGVINHFENFKSEFVDARNVDVWLPEGYAESEGKAFPVIYMNDGQNLFDPTNSYGGQEWGIDEAISKLSKAKKIPEAIVVGIWNTPKRYQEYMPQKPFYELDRAIGADLLKVYGGVPVSDNYLKFIVEELKPFIDSAYRTKAGRQETFIMGSSMGGLISMYAVCEYPQVFRGAGCLSTHWIGDKDAEQHAVSDAFVSYLFESLPDAGGHLFYFDYGTEGLDAYYEAHQEKIDQVMRAKGYKQGKDWVTQKYDGHDHNEKYWRKRIDVPLMFLLENNN
jgi:predicted alpha/beta superfamily hydrolase